MTAADSPAAEPKNASNAGTKSPVDSPCRYSSGSTSATLGLLRHQGGRITDRNRIRSPLTGSVRRSSTRGARTGTTPAAVVTARWRAWPLRTTNRRPASSRSTACAARYASTSASNAAASIRRAPSRTIASRSKRSSSCAWASVTTLSMRRSFPAGVHRAGAPRTCHPGRYAALTSPDPIHNFRSYLQVPSTPALLASIKRIVKLHKHVNPGRDDGVRESAAQGQGVRGRPRPHQASDLRWS
jgi:hypothetical protein